MSSYYAEVKIIGDKIRVQRPNSKRLVHPVAECNRLLDRIEELEAELRGAINCTNQQEEDKFNLDVENEQLVLKYDALVDGIKGLHDNLVGAFPTRDSINDEGWRIVRALEKELRALLEDEDEG